MSSRKATVEPLGDFVPDVLAAINFGTVVLIWSSSPGSKRCCLCSTGLLPWLVSSYSWEAIISRVDIRRPLISFLFVSAWWWLISVRSPPATWRSARSPVADLQATPQPLSSLNPRPKCFTLLSFFASNLLRSPISEHVSMQTICLPDNERSQNHGRE
jgi:hypothetical protein